MTDKIFVTHPFLPPKEEFLNKVSEIFDAGILTNQGPQVAALEQTLKSFLGVDNFHYVTNGTIALQLALKALREMACGASLSSMQRAFSA